MAAQQGQYGPPGPPESVGKSATVEKLAPYSRNACNSRDITGAAELTARILVDSLVVDISKNNRHIL
jgi:hypothetical protein